MGGQAFKGKGRITGYKLEPNIREEVIEGMKIHVVGKRQQFVILVSVDSDIELDMKYFDKELDIIMKEVK